MNSCTFASSPSEKKKNVYYSRSSSASSNGRASASSGGTSGQARVVSRAVSYEVPHPIAANIDQCDRVLCHELVDDFLCVRTLAFETGMALKKPGLKVNVQF